VKDAVTDVLMMPADKAATEQISARIAR